MSSSPPPGEPGSHPSVARPLSPAGPMGPPPGPRHSRATGPTLWRGVRIAALGVLAVALMTVPMVWVQRADAPVDADSALVDAPENGSGRDAEPLAFSTVDPTPDPAPSPASTQAPAQPS